MFHGFTDQLLEKVSRFTLDHVGVTTLARVLSLSCGQGTTDRIQL